MKQREAYFVTSNGDTPERVYFTIKEAIAERSEFINSFASDGKPIQLYERDVNGLYSFLDGKGGRKLLVIEIPIFVSELHCWLASIEVEWGDYPIESIYIEDNFLYLKVHGHHFKFRTPKKKEKQT
jgi:hypothetical protein